MTVIKARPRTHYSMIDGSNGDLEDLVGLLRQVWFGTVALETFKRDNLDTDAATVQHSRTTFRPDVEIEPPEEVPINSESSTSIGIQKAEVKFAVRDVTELVIGAGQQTDKGRETQMNDVGGTAQGAVAGKIGRLLRSKRSFSERQVQKGKCMIPCDEQLCSFPMLSVQESSQARQVDRGVLLEIPVVVLTQGEFCVTFPFVP